MNIDFITIFTDKLQESIQFYTDVLGFTVMREADAGNGVKLVFLTDGYGGDIELIDHGLKRPLSQNCPIALTIKLDSIETAVELTETKNIEPIFGPATMPSGVKLLHIEDPNGITINFVVMPEDF